MKTFLNKAVSAFAVARSGATAIEYAILAGCIALAIIGAVSQLGQATNDNFVAVQAGFN
jgi:Flp pilus assembly pilin Flp